QITLIPAGQTPNDGPDHGEINIGIDAAATAANLLAYISGHASDPRPPVTAARTNVNVYLTAKTRGVTGNLIALSTNDGEITGRAASTNGPWLSGGSYAPDADRYFVESTNGVPESPGRDAETHVAPAIEPTGSSGVWRYSPPLNRIDPTFFGAYSETNMHHNRRLLQAAVRASSLHGYVVDIKREWKVDRPVRLLDNAILEGTTPSAAIVCVGNNNAPSPLRAGGWSAHFVPNADSVLIDDLGLAGVPEPYFEHIRWVDCTKPNARTLLFEPDSWSTFFPVGATIFVREKAYFYSEGQMPLFLMPNVVTGTILGQISLEYPISRHLDSPQVALATHPISLISGSGDTAQLVKGKVMPDNDGQRGAPFGGPISVVRNVRITNIGLASRPPPSSNPDVPDAPGTLFAPNTGLLGCTINLTWTEGRTAAAFNCLAHSRVTIDTAQVWEKGVEIALGGGKSSVVITTLNTVRHRDNNVGAVIQLTENVHDTDVTVTRLNVNNDYVPGSYIAVIRAATYCSLTITSLNIFGTPQSPDASWSGAVLGILNEARNKTVDRFESQSRTDNIEVNLPSVTGGPVERYIYMSNEGGLMRDITVTGQFGVERRSGSYPAHAIQLRGRNVTVSGSMRSGMVDIRQTDGVSVNIESADPTSGFIEDSSTINVVAKTIT
ncbi:MAG TPA: hypothetical protein VGW34_11025, partial [Allosphingosinicella sp.]|nr:hypothetical protein [Allosphingosinicella sp.]